MELEPTFGAELDLPPEYCRYRDEGCELAESCLNCPFPICIYDEPGVSSVCLKGSGTEKWSGFLEIKGKE